ncbi:cold shock domain-containing protein [Streptomyces sp. NBC_01142]|nr:hypothetical protein [Streptomyces sp. NBC_01142]MCX4826405.1 cold shock domain-containing protein [Streptomyces sp. NBC_01142]
MASTVLEVNAAGMQQLPRLASFDITQGQKGPQAENIVRSR